MINWKSILSSFNDKPTLLEWLKLVEKALKESVLKDVTINQNGSDIAFTFNFEDGTSISTPTVTLPKGNTGAKGDKGDKGEQGVSVTGVDEVSNEVVSGQTLTTLRFNFSDGTNNEVVVHAENGKNASGGGKLYLHKLSIVIPEGAQAQLKFLSPDSSKITTVTNELLAKMISGLASNSFPPVYYDIRESAVSNDTMLSLTVYNAYPFNVTQTSNYEINMTHANILDKVTEL